MKRISSSRLLDFFWYLLILFLPFTSLPIASILLQSEMVAAPSIIFLAILLALIIAFMGRKLLISRTILQPILLFGLIAILSSLLSFFLPIPIQKDFSIFRNIVEGLGTLFIGISFYFVTITMIQNNEKKIITLQFIAFSFIPLSIWCIFQFVFGQIIHDYPNWMVELQKLITTSGTLFKDRLTGFAFEPSWLAHQMNMFYIPIWISASFTRQSAFKKIKNKIIFEDLLLMLSVFILFLSKSRVGLITFIFVLFYILYKLNQKLIRDFKIRHISSTRKLLIKLFPFILVLLYLIIIIFGLFFISQFDSRMENLLKLETYQNRNIFSIANEFVFAERILYWQTGWQIFNDFPILGVGLGNSGFFFEDYMPSFAWALEEPRHLIFQANYQGNIKNLWFRLLSETGIIGFLSFVTWLIFIFLVSNQLERSRKYSHSFWGLVGKIAIISLVFEGFSIDSFALPYYWILFGLFASNYENIESPIED